jgi:hypothetical protein
MGNVSDVVGAGEDPVQRGDGAFEEDVVGFESELGVGPAGLVVPLELDSAACADAADDPGKERVDPVAAVGSVVGAQRDVGPDDAGRDAAGGEGFVDGLDVGPVRQAGSTAGASRAGRAAWASPPHDGMTGRVTKRGGRRRPGR